MRIVPIVAFALAVAAGASMLPAARSFAQDQQYPTQAQNCESGNLSATEGVGDCRPNRPSSREDRTAQGTSGANAQTHEAGTHAGSTTHSSTKK